jgi:hypothetical protein
VKNNQKVFSIVACLVLAGCASAQLPSEHHEHYSFPESRVYIEEPTGKAANVPYKVLGWVRSKANYPTMEQEVNNQTLCRNYYNKAAKSLLKEAKKANADAVIKVRSVVFLIDGKSEVYPTPECSDDGAEGEILLRGIAIKFIPPSNKTKAEEDVEKQKTIKPSPTLDTSEEVLKPEPTPPAPVTVEPLDQNTFQSE